MEMIGFSWPIDFSLKYGCAKAMTMKKKANSLDKKSSLFFNSDTFLVSDTIDFSNLVLVKKIF
jgi:hypothetical protein